MPIVQQWWQCHPPESAHFWINHKRCTVRQKKAEVQCAEYNPILGWTAFYVHCRPCLPGPKPEVLIWKNALMHWSVSFAVPEWRGVVSNYIVSLHVQKMTRTLKPYRLQRTWVLSSGSMHINCTADKCARATPQTQTKGLEVENSNGMKSKPWDLQVAECLSHLLCSIDANHHEQKTVWHANHVLTTMRVTTPRVQEDVQRYGQTGATARLEGHIKA